MKTKVGELGGIEAVVKVISTHVGNAKVCQNGCLVLAYATDENGKNTDKQNNIQAKLNQTKS